MQKIISVLLSHIYVFETYKDGWESSLYKTSSQWPDTVRRYVGDMEIVSSGPSEVCRFYYLGHGVVLRKVNNAVTPLFAFTDNLGSVTRLYTEAGTEKFRAQYDPWGVQVVNRNDVNFARGYCGHEMLNDFQLINMNGRMYDPVLGRFLSPDNYVQMPNSAQGFNRYSYCLNNPLKYVDPDGEFFFSALLPGIGMFLDAACWGAVIGGAGYTASIAFSKGGFNNWNWGQFGKSLGFGAVSGVLTAGIGQTFGAIGSNGIIGEVGRAFSHGLANGLISDLQGGDFVTGFASGGLSSLAGSAFMMYGGSLANSTIGTYAFSGFAGGAGAALTGGNFWEGTSIGLMNAGLNHLQLAFTHLQLVKMYKVYVNSYLQYPTPESFYESIGGPLGNWAKDCPEEFNNTCAARLSKALNYSGFEIKKNTPQTYLGGDGKYYFINAKAMQLFLSKKWGEPRLLINGQTLKNAVFFQTGFSKGITGHLDIMYNRKPAHEFYKKTTYYWH